jgi:hypothetical protein
MDAFHAGPAVAQRQSGLRGTARHGLSIVGCGRGAGCGCGCRAPDCPINVRISLNRAAPPLGVVVFWHPQVASMFA